MKLDLPEEPDIAELIDRAHEAQAEKPRRHLGCSLVGHNCDRWIWLSFRWAVQEGRGTHEEGLARKTKAKRDASPHQRWGQMLRLFRRGHNEEDTIQSDLELIGVKFESRQSRVDFGSFVSGSTDGIITGVPGAPKTRHLLECKTHSKKSFEKLLKEGLLKAKPQHYGQKQTYMKGEGLTRGLYYAVCKDDDRIYTERVRYDAQTATALVERGQRLALSDRLPEPMLGASATWWECKFCAGYGICWENKGTKEKNCRTCTHWEPHKDSTWTCGAGHSAIDYDGCEHHQTHADLVPVERLVRKRGLF